MRILRKHGQFTNPNWLASRANSVQVGCSRSELPIFAMSLHPQELPLGARLILKYLKCI